MICSGISKTNTNQLPQFHTIQVHTTHCIKQYSSTLSIKNKINNGTYAHTWIC